jgi:hypothetical protein
MWKDIKNSILSFEFFEFGIVVGDVILVVITLLGAIDSDAHFFKLLMERTRNNFRNYRTCNLFSLVMYTAQPTIVTVA